MNPFLSFLLSDIFPGALHPEHLADLRKSGLQYIVLGPVTDDPKQIDLMAKKVVKHFK